LDRSDRSDYADRSGSIRGPTGDRMYFSIQIIALPFSILALALPFYFDFQ
jgi:hypothetical protein